MYYKKNLSLYDSTFPFVWVCLFTWWVDRLLVELGHRSSLTDICLHNDLQYVNLHQYIFASLVLIQIVVSTAKRYREYDRESQLVQSTPYNCNIVWIFCVQCVLVSAWSVIFSVLLDVSPWLCVKPVVEYRALIACFSLACIVVTLPIETLAWDKSLQYGLINEV